MVDCQVNRRFLPVKVLYFCILAGLSCLQPYLPVYMSNLGLVALEIGVIRGVEPFVSFLCKPLWGVFTDKFRVHKTVFFTAILATSIFNFAIYMVHPVPTVTETSVVTVTLPPHQCLVNGTTALPTPTPDPGQGGHTPTPDPGQVGHTTTPDPGEDPVYALSQLCLSCCDSQPEGLCFELMKYWNCDSCLKCPTGDLSQPNDNFTLQEQSGLEGDHVLVRQTCPPLCLYDNSSDPHTCSCPCSLLSTPRPPAAAATPTPGPCAYNQTLTETGRGRSTTTFALVLVFVVVAVAFACIVQPLLDAATTEMLGERRADFGRQRLWGAVGWGLFALVAGVSIDAHARFEPAHHLDYASAFFLFLTFNVLALVATFFLPFPTLPAPPAMLPLLLKLVRRPEVASFFFLVFVFGLCMGVITTFLFYYLATELGALHLLMGLSLTVTCLSEIPFLFYSGPIIRQLGHIGVFYLTIICYAIRFVGYSLIRNPWWFLPLELLHGVTFGLLFATSTSYASLIAPPGMATTIQTLNTALLFGLGKGCGGLLGGLVYHHFGGPILFRSCAVLVLAAGIVFFLVNRIAAGRKAKYSRVTGPDSVFMSSGPNSVQQEASPSHENGPASSQADPGDLTLNLRSSNNSMRPTMVHYDQVTDSTRRLILDASPDSAAPSQGDPAAADQPPTLDLTSVTRPPLEGDEDEETSRPNTPGLDEGFFIDDQFEDVATEYMGTFA